ncbi:transcription termination/antitermination protein NusA [Candidatus Mycoplasma pogonae]
MSTTKKEINSDNINQIIFSSMEDIARIRKIDYKLVEEIFTNAIIKAFHKKIDADAEIVVKIDHDAKVFKLFNENAIVVTDEEYQEQDPLLANVLVGETVAKEIDPKLQEGDVFVKEFTLNSLPGSIHNVISQTFKQKIVEIVRQSVYDKYLPLKGEIVRAKYISHNRNGYIFELEDGAIGVMPSQLTNRNLEPKLNKWIDVYIEDVVLETRDAQIILSNSSIYLLKKALERSIPEISTGEIEVMGVARIPGVRSKAAVRLAENSDSGIQELGSIIGKEGKRIATIQEALNGERIDIFRWSDDLYEYIAESLSPAKVVSINFNKSVRGKESYIVVVPNIQNTVAIGKKGINASLASELTKVRLDIISVDQANEKGIEILWNGNVTPEEVAKIEAGERWSYRSQNQQKPEQTDNTNKTTNNFKNWNANIDLSEFDDEIADYRINVESNEQVEDENASVVEFDQNVIDVDKIIEDHLNEVAAEEAEKINASHVETTTITADDEKIIKKVANDIKNFKFDNDLASYAGLNDLEIDDEDWD